MCVCRGSFLGLKFLRRRPKAAQHTHQPNSCRYYMNLSLAASTSFIFLIKLHFYYSTQQNNSSKIDLILSNGKGIAINLITNTAISVLINLFWLLHNRHLALKLELFNCTTCFSCLLDFCNNSSFINFIL